MGETWPLNWHTFSLLEKEAKQKPKPKEEKGKSVYTYITEMGLLQGVVVVRFASLPLTLSVDLSSRSCSSSGYLHQASCYGGKATQEEPTSRRRGPLGVALAKGKMHGQEAAREKNVAIPSFFLFLR